MEIGFVTFSTGATLVGGFEAGSDALDTALGNVVASGQTSFDAALQQALTFFGNQGATTSDVNVVYFLSDGVHNGGTFTDEVADLETLYNARIQAVGIGSGASLAQLNQMDNTGGAQLVDSLPLLSAELQDPFSDAEVVDFRIFVDGVQDLSFDVSDLTPTVLGYDINAQALSGLTTTAGDSSIIIAEIVFDDDGDGIGDTVLRNTLSVLSVAPEVDTATLSVTVTGANADPDAVDDFAGVGEDGPGVAIDVLANDTDPDASDVPAILGIDTTGTVGTVAINDGGTPGDPSDDVIDYDPAGAFESLAVGETALDTFTYTVTDGNGGTDTATVTVTVDRGANDGPDAVDDGVSTDSATTVSAVVTANDTDPDVTDDLEILSIDTTGTAGLVTVDADNDTVHYDPNGAFDALGLGQTAIDTFTYTITDGNGGTDTATVSVTVSGLNDPPDAVDDVTFGLQNQPVIFDVLANDSDPKRRSAGGHRGCAPDRGRGVGGLRPGRQRDVYPGLRLHGARGGQLHDLGRAGRHRHRDPDDHRDPEPRCRRSSSRSRSSCPRTRRWPPTCRAPTRRAIP